MKIPTLLLLVLDHISILIIVVAEENVNNGSKQLKIPKRNIRKSGAFDLDNLENGLNNKGSHESLSFPIMGGRGLMRDEYEEERAKLIKE